jgi:SAM-dependent methyltransferase
MDTADFDRLAELLDGGLPASEIHTDRPSPARIYDYWLGGKNNYPVDREVAETIMALAPTTPASIRENRDFLLRAVRYLADQGIDQFLDLGCGLPFSPNVHEVAQSVVPDACVAYVDSDPIVLRHAHALMERSDPQHIAVIHADVRKPEDILQHPDALRVLDFDKPVGILLVAVLHFVADAEEPERLIRQLTARFPAGSYLVISHGTPDFNVAGAMEATENYRSTSAYNARTRASIEALFNGMPLIAPGLVPIAQWPDTSLDARAAEFGMYAGIARKEAPGSDA